LKVRGVREGESSSYPLSLGLKRGEKDSHSPGCKSKKRFVSLASNNTKPSARGRGKDKDDFVHSRGGIELSGGKKRPGRGMKWGKFQKTKQGREGKRRQGAGWKIRMGETRMKVVLTIPKTLFFVWGGPVLSRSSLSKSQKVWSTRSVKPNKKRRTKNKTTQKHTNSKNQITNNKTRTKKYTRQKRRNKENTKHNWWQACLLPPKAHPHNKKGHSHKKERLEETTCHPLSQLVHEQFNCYHSQSASKRVPGFPRDKGPRR